MSLNGIISLWIIGMLFGGLCRETGFGGGGGLWVFLLLISIKFLIRIITPWDLRLVDFL